MIQFYNVCLMLLAQTQIPGSAGGGAAAAPAAEKQPGFFDNMGFMLPAMIAVMLLYFMLMAKPKAGTPAKKSEMLSKLKKNDRVLTAGGILGTVVNFRSDDEYITLRIDDASNARMQVLASSIVRVVSDDDTKS
jgi:preprotein translocase subunit YajC